MIDLSKGSLIGKKVKVIDNVASGHGAEVGTIGTIKSATPNNIRLKEFPSFNFYNSELELVAMTREELEKEISNLQVKIQTRQEKLQFMTDNNLAEFDETQYKVFKTLAALDNKDISDIEKSKLIASLING
jgi:hypothetical protein